MSFNFYIFHNKIRKYLCKGKYTFQLSSIHARQGGDLVCRKNQILGRRRKGNERNYLWPRRITARLFLLGFRGLCREHTENVVLCYPPSDSSYDLPNARKQKWPSLTQKSGNQKHPFVLMGMSVHRYSVNL